MTLPEWKDRRIERENTYNVLNNKDGTITLIPVTGEIYESGTPLNAINLNKINASLKQKINLNENIFYDEINIEKKRDEISGTTYHLVTIPTHDKDGNFIKLKTGVSEYYETNPNRHDDDGLGTDYNNNPKLETARDFSKRKNATLVINAGTWGSQGANGNCIVNGEIKASESLLYKRMPLGIKEDNTLVAYDYKLSAQKNLNDGALDVVPGFYPIMVNGKKYSGSLEFNWELKHPRTVIGQKANKEIILIVATGRRKNENGMSMNDCFRILSDNHCIFGYNLDGGGSTSLVYRNEFLNEKIDKNRKQERKLYNFIYISKEKPNSKISEEILLNSISMGDLRSLIQDTITDLFDKFEFNTGYIRLRGDEGYQYQGIESWDGENKNTKLTIHKDFLRYYDYNNEKTIFSVNKEGNITTQKGTLGLFNKTVVTNTNLNEINESGLYWATKDSVGVPYPISCGILHIQIGSSSKMQIAFPFSTNNTTYKIMIRRTDTNGDYYEWKEY